jgi:predicted dinucleotide-binding enzyme
MHVVFGAGQVGLALASRLAGQGVSAWRAPVTVSGSAGTLIPAGRLRVRQPMRVRRPRASG